WQSQSPTESNLARGTSRAIAYPPRTSCNFGRAGSQALSWSSRLRGVPSKGPIHVGKMHYGDSAIFQFNDRLLTHLRTIILAKFALQESLALTWHDSDQQRTVWLHPSIPLHFEFSGSETP